MFKSLKSEFGHTDPNPQTTITEPEVRKSSTPIYYQIMIAVKIHYSYLHMKSGIACPQAKSHQLNQRWFAINAE